MEKMTEKQAKARAEKFLEFMNIKGVPVNKPQFMADYPGDEDEAELIWYFIDQMI